MAFELKHGSEADSESKKGIVWKDKARKLENYTFIIFRLIIISIFHHQSMKKNLKHYNIDEAIG